MHKYTRILFFTISALIALFSALSLISALVGITEMPNISVLVTIAIFMLPSLVIYDIYRGNWEIKTSHLLNVRKGFWLGIALLITGGIIIQLIVIPAFFDNEFQWTALRYQDVAILYNNIGETLGYWIIGLFHIILSLLILWLGIKAVASRFTTKQYNKALNHDAQ